MLSNFQEYINTHNLAPQKGTTLLAVSGGVDSVVLSHLFLKSGLSFAIAHCNFKLRGDKSDGDEHFVTSLAELHKVQCYKIAFDTENISAKEKLSIQLTARNLRYEWFQKLALEHQFGQIATAHHMNDRIETFLYNFTKGTGIRGLCNMSPKTGNITRPLLFASKEKILEYATQNNLTYREDASNSSTKYSRNRIRKEAIPVLQSINPALEKTALDTFKNLEDTEALFQWAIQEHRSKLLSKKEDNFYIDFDKLKESIAPKTLLFEMISPFGFSSDQVKSILQQQTRSSGAQFFTPEYTLVISRNQLIITKNKSEERLTTQIQKTDNQVQISKYNIDISRTANLPTTFTKSKSSAWLDVDKLQFPLIVRPWEPGDFFHPIGMNGNKQKLKKYFVNQKLSLIEKQNVYVLLSGDDVCWVIGHRMDERFKIDSTTKEGILFEIQ